MDLDDDYEEPDKYTTAFERTVSDQRHGKATPYENTMDSWTTWTLTLSTLAVNDEKSRGSLFPDREGDGPHHLYSAYVSGSPIPQPVFFNSGSGPGRVKERCVSRFDIPSFATNRRARVSGFGKGVFQIVRDCTLYIGFVTTDSENPTWLKTTAGVVPDVYHIPSDVLIGRGVLEKLGVQHMTTSDLIFNGITSRPWISPIPNTNIYSVNRPVESQLEQKIPPDGQMFPSVFDSKAKRQKSIEDHGIRHTIDT